MKTAKIQALVGLWFALGGLGHAAAQGMITFGGQPALLYGKVEAQGAGSAVADVGTLVVQPQSPGYSRAIMAPVTPAESEKAIQSRSLGEMNTGVPIHPAGVGAKRGAARVTGDTAALAPASIPELARALRGNPDLIYEYVRNNIATIPTWGILKGEFGALLDNQGTAFDQAALMIALLRQSGYTASFVKGRVSLNAAQFKEWFGIDTNRVCAVLNLIASAQIPVSSIAASAGGSCPGSTAALSSLKLDHVWVKVIIDGTAYYFDPSYKPHTIKPGVDLVGATGYNAASFMSTATTGATITADYVQGLNRTGVRNNLTVYAGNLATYLRTNLPTATLDDVVGGKTIVPHSGGPLRQASLPYQDRAVTLTEWTGNVPDNYKPTLRIQYQGINRTFTSDAIYGRRLTLTYNASSQPVLSLDGTALVTGTAVATGTYGNVTLTVTHGAYTSAVANQSFAQQVKAGGTYVISNGWGPGGRGPIELHRARLDQALASGASATSEAALGSSLAVLASTWIGQANQSNYITDRIARTNTLLHHQVGIAGYNTASYVDLPGNMVSVVSQDASTAKEAAVFFSAAMHSSIFESTAVQQTTGTSAVSTVKLIDMAVLGNRRIYDAKAANFASAVQPNLVGCAGYIASFQSSINAGRRLILPNTCTLNEGSWTGVGFFDVLATANGSSLGAIISGGLAGGFSTSPQTAALTNTNILKFSNSTNSLTPSTGSWFGDPVDMTKGNFLYAHSDLESGIGSFPASLSFSRSYASGSRTQNGTLGLGWTSNVNARLRTGSDGFQGMGEDSGLDAVSAVTEKLVSVDLLTDATKPVANMVLATLGQRWFGEQVTDNTVIVSQGMNGEVFTRLPDGTFNSPPANSAKLVRNADGSYGYETLNRALLAFDTTGKLVTYTDPSGLQAKYTYSGDLVTRIANSLGRSLALTYASNRVSSVTDGSRTISFGYDASGNLTSFTNTLGAITTYQYDLPGRMSKLFYPANPTVPFMTNVYDSLGRVQTQTNALGKVYTYYFAGSRSEEIGPYNQSMVSYVDENGKVLKSIDPLGAVTVHTYDGQTRLVKSVFAEGGGIEYTYDDAPCASQQRCTHNKAVVRQIAKTGSGLSPLATSYTYEQAFNQVASATDPRQLTTHFTYTAQGAPSTVSAPADPNGVRPVTTYSYTAFSSSGFPAFYLPTAVSNKISADSSVTDTTSYASANGYVPLTSVRDAGGLNLTTTFTYDSVGNLTRIDGPRTDVTDVTSTTYNAERRPLQITDALGKVTRNAYDADGRLVRSAAQAGTQWLVSCNSFSLTGKVTRSWGPALSASDTACPAASAPVSVSEYAYDDLERTIRKTEVLPTAQGGSRITETAYNLDNTVASVSHAVGTADAQVNAAYTYTAGGQVASVKDANNNLTTYEYDGHGRLARMRFPDKATPNASSATDVETYSYDANGNAISLVRRDGTSIFTTYDNLDRMTARTYPDSASNIAYTYDLQSRMLTARYADPASDLQWSYDKTGRQVGVTAGGRTLAYQYDAGGNRVRTTWPDAFFVTTTYDVLNRPMAIQEGGNVALASYAYDDRSRRTTIARGNGSTTTYAYSPQSALSSLSHNLAGTAHDVNWTYNRNQVQEVTDQTWSNDLYGWSGHANGARSYDSNGLNQYTQVAGSTFSHDPNGNLTGDGTWTYGYDGDGRLTSAGKQGLAATLAYDPLGRLRKTVIAGVASELLYSGTDLVAEYDAAGQLARRYVHGPGVDEVLVQYEGAGSTDKSWLYADNQGSIVARADGAGVPAAVYAYGPFGETAADTGPRFRFTGQQYLSELGLSYYKTRFYSPSLGRFLQPDTIGYADGLNLYAYVGNDPVNLNDPSGNCPSCLGAGSSVVLGGAIRYVTSGGDWSSVFDMKSMAIDAGMGAVGAGLTSKLTNLASMHRLSSIGTRANDINRSKAVGALGEKMLGIAPDGKKLQAAANGVRTVPDEFVPFSRLYEVKNVKAISAKDAKQIHAQTLLAKEFDAPMTLWTRPGADLSKIQHLIDNGAISAVKNIPGIATNGARMLKNGEAALVGGVSGIVDDIMAGMGK